MRVFFSQKKEQDNLSNEKHRVPAQILSSIVSKNFKESSKKERIYIHSPTEEKVVSPLDLDKANFAIKNMLEEIILNTIQDKYPEYCGRVQSRDFKFIKIDAEKTIAEIRNSGLIDESDNLVSDPLNNEEALKKLKNA